MASNGSASSHITLNNGRQMPVVGLGTWQAAPGVVGAAVDAAVRGGYRHIDCAYAYFNEKEVGDALQKLFKEGVVKREDLWITSKLWNDHHGPEEPFKCLETTLTNLQLEYLDLYLIHWPVPLNKGYTWPLQPHMFDTTRSIKEDTKETWQAMEKIAESGKARSIGVSNFSAKKLEDMMEYAKVVPAVNQVECHPMWRQDKLRAYMKTHNIHLSAYSPLGTWGTSGVKINLLDHPLLTKIGEKYGRTPAQVSLRWGVQMGNSVLPKSTKAERVKENLQVSDFSLSDEDMSELEKLEQTRFLQGTFWVNDSGSFYKKAEDLWDGEGI
ncbi:protein MpTPS-like1 [Marchantia polymorpha subsp. ruderalis]|uniref:NADP-dependent oxidoreductase domain-containing protein n=2 Tax=Marchantia polymorpha TaxID=3197 RepID=A0AAF6C023_MARPO|nr:hypothetical protein MARPO_0111s0050 [Marchantia polymorpha]PTQ31495.1 hypothetical protein MARPO_0111s0050 [Marchantia polymorpha]BBN17607.1 hypothetical protein Mp_7g15690 [Marchantia polymorpha subsp. ruderalis]BBN17608.1 hypothetical protein Mp_7g15690 [Marchantia polymorpha subsp. ruderalis]|eukprot:PTQ31494.1 hypothetical protein MARPO_0111s0050 [Marchantia polymorpha]